jgi:microcystin-dependent protein
MTTTDRLAGLNGSVGFKAPCRVATTAAITLSGEQTIDGVAIVANDRVLVKNQSSGVDNGIYIASTGAWSRALDFDGARDARNGTLVYVTSGSANGDQIFVTSGTDPITVGTTSLSFAAADISGTVYTLTAGDGLTGGGTLNADRTVALATIADDRVMANISGSTAVPSANTLSAIIDATIGSTRGQILYRGASSWLALAAGTSGYVLTANGAGADPSWAVTGAATSVPAGAVSAFAMSTPPAGWLECDGSAVSRATYSALFTAISTTFGVGDGSTTFNLPDLRGEFVRGWANARAVDTGRAFGSTQAEMIGPHNHTASSASSSSSSTSGSFSGTTASGGAHSHAMNPSVLIGSETSGTAGVPNNTAIASPGTTLVTDTASAHTHTVSGSISASTSTTTTTTTTVNNNSGTENRVRNVALMYCIKT